MVVYLVLEWFMFGTVVGYCYVNRTSKLKYKIVSQPFKNIAVP